MIDYDKLREDLMNQVGPAMFMYGPAFIELIDIESATEDELEEKADEYGFNLDDYKERYERRRNIR